jgi:hypothetical protein
MHDAFNISGTKRKVSKFPINVLGKPFGIDYTPCNLNDKGKSSKTNLAMVSPREVSHQEP